jgi:hypothetical protein
MNGYRVENHPLRKQKALSAFRASLRAPCVQHCERKQLIWLSHLSHHAVTFYNIPIIRVEITFGITQWKCAFKGRGQGRKKNIISDGPNARCNMPGNVYVTLTHKR